MRPVISQLITKSTLLHDKSSSFFCFISDSYFEAGRSSGTGQRSPDGSSEDDARGSDHNRGARERCASQAYRRAYYERKRFQLDIPTSLLLGRRRGFKSSRSERRVPLRVCDDVGSSSFLQGPTLRITDPTPTRP